MILLIKLNQRLLSLLYRRVLTVLPIILWKNFHDNINVSNVGDLSGGWTERSLLELLQRGVVESATLFTGLLHFTLDPYPMMLSVKQGGIKYYFLVFAMTRPGIEPQSPEQLANTTWHLLVRIISRWITAVAGLEKLIVFYSMWQKIEYFILYESLESYTTEMIN